MSDFFPSGYFPFGYFPAFWGAAEDGEAIPGEMSATLSGAGALTGALSLAITTERYGGVGSDWTPAPRAKSRTIVAWMSAQLGGHGAVVAGATAIAECSAALEGRGRIRSEVGATVVGIKREALRPIEPIRPVAPLSALRPLRAGDFTDYVPLAQRGRR